MQISHELFPKHHIITHSVDPAHEGVRLDAFIKRYYRSRSRAQVQEAISRGAVTVKRKQSPHLNLGKIKSSTQLVSGDEVLIRTEKKYEPPVSFDYKILYEDENLFVINKPANLPVHPAGKYFFHTLLTHLKTNGFREPMRADRDYFLVHRIDRETSGILVLTKDRTTCAHLISQFAERKTEKTYLAIVHGHIREKEFQVDIPMGRSPRSLITIKMFHIPESKGGLTALTRFKVRKLFERDGKKYSLVECFPKTGRQHQIRVHLAHAGYPIVGDKLYSLTEDEAIAFYESGGAHTLSPEMEARLVLPRHALHAAGIRFLNPHTGKKVSFESSLPDELAEFSGQRLVQALP